MSLVSLSMIICSYTRDPSVVRREAWRQQRSLSAARLHRGEPTIAGEARNQPQAVFAKTLKPDGSSIPRPKSGTRRGPAAPPPESRPRTGGGGQNAAHRPGSWRRSKSSGELLPRQKAAASAVAAQRIYPAGLAPPLRQGSSGENDTVYVQREMLSS